jgi:hypothetical protein
MRSLRFDDCLPILWAGKKFPIKSIVYVISTPLRTQLSTNFVQNLGVWRKTRWPLPGDA